MESVSTVDSTPYLARTVQNLIVFLTYALSKPLRLQHVSTGLELSVASEVCLQIREKTKNGLANAEIRNILAHAWGRVARHKPAQQDCFWKRTSDGSSFSTYI